VVAEHDGDGSF